MMNQPFSKDGNPLFVVKSSKIKKKNKDNDSSDNSHLTHPQKQLA